MKIGIHRLRYLLSLMIFCLVGFSLLSGCAGKKGSQVREDLVGARAMVRAAELAGADEVAPNEIALVRQELAAAERDLEREPQTGRLTVNILEKKDQVQRSAERIEAVRQGASRILAKIDSEKHLTVAAPQADLFPAESTGEIEQRVRQDLSLEYDRKLEEELSARLDVAEAAWQMEHPEPEPLFESDPFENLSDDLLQALDEELRLMGIQGVELIPETLAIRFIGKEMLFNHASTWVRPGLKQAVEQVVPVLLRVLSRPEFQDGIKAVWVEGYASSGYTRAQDDNERYYLNLLLSQERAANALRIILAHPSLAANPWLASLLTPLGLSGTSPIVQDDGLEDLSHSRRLEIRIGL
ncbi:MAG: hypothetical protein KJ950_01660 [Proteobacteria bacterium]|nr:hypothetical protein [Pseudomonadota bacterium]MBU1688205.1 hypothetical protein [Pseudomonadota bacterium]